NLPGKSREREARFNSGRPGAPPGPYHCPHARRTVGHLGIRHRQRHLAGFGPDRDRHRDQRGWRAVHGHAERGPRVVTQTLNVSGNSPYVYAFAASTLMAAYVMYGFDSAAELSEETSE